MCQQKQVNTSQEQHIKPIDYLDCSKVMMMMWMENIVTDGEYNRIMDKLNKSEMCKRYMNGKT